MWIEILPAKLPAKACPPQKTLIPFGGLDDEVKQQVMPDFRCPPKPVAIGGLEVVLIQILTPTFKTPRLTTCALFGGHIVSRSQFNHERRQNEHVS